jgi:UDP-N-acetylglucosamine--N-acetylmuramyl-(pentapeptide) pyrophosphoryl-undecaprenol N-acetylglucosamine transferase
MRIGLVGGGTGGHFYPLMAVSEVLRERHPEKDLHLFYFGPDKYNADYLNKYQINFVHIPAGKRRLYYSVQNYFDIFVIAWGIFVALMKLPIIYPDVIFSKGGFTAYPVLFAARILRIPVVVHDSDTVPGRVSLKFAKYARMVAIGWAEGGRYFLNSAHIKEEKITDTGVPTRKILNPMYKYEKPKDYVSALPPIKKSLPLISVLGGSLGSQNVNEAIMACLPFILPIAQVFHQTGHANFDIVSKTTKNLLDKTDLKDNYFCKDFFTEPEMRDIYSNSSLIIMRSGSQILETFMWGVPTILIPIAEDVSRDQTSNAFAAMRRGAAIVIEEKNLTPHILQNEIIKLLQDNKSLARMSATARESAKFDASEKLATILLKFCKSHE